MSLPDPGNEEPRSRRPDGRPPRRRSALPWLVAGAMVVAAATVLVVLFAAGQDTGGATGLAEEVAAAYDENTFEDLVELSCAGAEERMARIVAQLRSADGLDLSARLVGVEEIADGRARAQVEVTFRHGPQDASGAAEEATGDVEAVGVDLSEEDGGWCVLGIDG